MPQPTERPCLNCKAESLPDAPFPICLRCTGLVTGFIRERMGLPSTQRLLPRTEMPDYLVYYIQVGEQIKIGTTSNLTARLQAFPPTAKLLAVERGGFDVERGRHQQFRALRVRAMNGGQTEWFRDDPALREHIATLASNAPD